MSTAKAMHAGILADNGNQVRFLQQTLSSLAQNSSMVPDLLEAIIDDEAWKHWLTVDGKEYKPADFRRFITGGLPAGCNTRPCDLEKVIVGTSVWEKYLALTVGSPGGNNNPYGRAGKPNDEINSDNVRVDSVPLPASVIPFSPPVPAKEAVERPATGNSVSYAIRRLKKEAPDLAEKVIKKEMSAYRASVQAGLIPEQITIPLVPARAARLLAKHFKPDELAALVRILTHGPGAEA